MSPFWIGKFRNGVGLSHALDRVGEPLDAWGRDWLEANNASFSDGGHQGHGGARWEAWAPITAERHKKYGWGDNILVVTGRLAQSLYLQRSIDGNAYTVRIGSKDWKSSAHQYGGYDTWRGPGTGIARPVIVMTGDDMTKKDAALGRHMYVAINGVMGSGMPKWSVS